MRLNNSLISIQKNLFDRLEELEEKIQGINSTINSLISIFEDEEESDNPVVVEKLRLKKIYRDEYNFNISLLRDITNILCGKNKPLSIKTQYFIETFNSTEDAVDHILKKLERHNILTGTKDLFINLAYDINAYSYSTERLFYVKYKFSKIFSCEVELVY